MMGTLKYSTDGAFAGATFITKFPYEFSFMRCKTHRLEEANI